MNKSPTLQKPPTFKATNSLNKSPTMLITEINVIYQ